MSPTPPPAAGADDAFLAERILASLSEGVAVFAADGCLRMANPACRHLLGRALRAGAPTAEVVPAGDPLHACIRQALAGIHLSNHDIHYRTPDGRRRWLRLDSMALTDPGGLPAGTMLALKDVSELKRVERHMGQVEKMSALGRLAASVAHEIGNPLGAIDIQLQLLDEDIAAAGNGPAAGGGLVERARRRLHIARAEMRRLDNIVHNFLRFSRPPALHLKRIHPNDFLQDIFTLVEPEAREHHITLRLEVSAATPCIEADHNQLGQAVLNLLINAFQAVPDGSTIDLECRADDDEVIITIRDRGRGIPEEDLERIFEFYYTTKDEGSGLGLSIAQRIVLQHGGVLTVESVEDEGTQVCMRLPAAD